MVGYYSTLALLWAPLALAATPHRLVTRSTLPSSFGLFGYGETIGGAPVFYSNGLAYLGDPRNVNGTVSDFVLFNTNNGSLVGNQNVTSDNPSWANVTFFVPSSTSTSHDIGFTTNTTSASDISTSGFTFYGGIVLHSEDDKLSTLWYASPTGTDNVWALKWNQTGDTTEGLVTVSLRTKPPTKPVVPPKDRKV